MATVAFGVAVSLDGFIAGPHDGPAQPLGEGGSALFDWYFDGDTPSSTVPGLVMSKVSADFFDGHVRGVTAVITGRRTYEIAGRWGGNSPVPGRPLFVLTHEPPSPLPETVVPTTFVTGGIAGAVTRAKAVAGDGVVSLAGSQAVQQALRAGLLDEFWVSVVPVLLGGGVRLFDGLGGAIRLDLLDVVPAPGVTHLGYRVRHD